MTKKESKLEKRLPKGRPKATHGGFSFLTHGRLPDHRVELRRYLSACRNGLIEDLGGDLSTQETILVDRSISLLGVIRCIEEYSKEQGVFNNGKLQPALGKNYISYTNSLKQILSLLGIDRNEMGREITPQDQAEIIRADLRTDESKK